MSISSIELFHYPATRSARVKWLLHELVGDAFTIHRVDLYGGEQYSTHYLRLNPNHAVPTLRVGMDDGSEMTLFESGAILAWLADAFPEKRLAPAPGPSALRADYMQMLFFGAAAMDMMLWQIRIHKDVLSDSQSDERTVVRYCTKFASEAEPQLRERLERASFICGETFTAADCTTGHCVGWAQRYGMCADPIFKAYLGRLSERPAYAAAFADAKQFVPQVPRNTLALGAFTG